MQADITKPPSWHPSCHTSLFLFRLLLAANPEVLLYHSCPLPLRRSRAFVQFGQAFVEHPQTWWPTSTYFNPQWGQNNACLEAGLDNSWSCLPGSAPYLCVLQSNEWSAEKSPNKRKWCAWWYVVRSPCLYFPPTPFFYLITNTCCDFQLCRRTINHIWLSADSSAH